LNTNKRTMWKYSSETDFTENQDENGFRYKARVNEHEVGQGSCRIAYKGKYVDSMPPGGPLVGSDCVVKVFKKGYDNDYKQWIPELKAHRRAVKMAKSFNQLQLSVSPRRTIRVLTPQIARVHTRGGTYLLGWLNLFPVSNVCENEYVSMEPFLEGQWQKFNNNGGWYDKSESAMLLQTFSHWTACKSRNKYLLCDLQGILSGNEYILTDPCIHSWDRIHGPTDIGKEGMIMVLIWPQMQRHM